MSSAAPSFLVLISRQHGRRWGDEDGERAAEGGVGRDRDDQPLGQYSHQHSHADTKVVIENISGSQVQSSSLPFFSSYFLPLPPEALSSINDPLSSLHKRSRPSIAMTFADFTAGGKWSGIDGIENFQLDIVGFSTQCSAKVPSCLLTELMESQGW